MRFVGRGHGSVRATHHKTRELITADEITERATCVVAVSSQAEPQSPMARPVRIRISVGSERFAFDAVANSSWDPAGPVVIRRSPLRLPGTFAIDATAAASDLPRPLVAALRSPDALVTVDVAPMPGTVPTVVLYAADATRGPDDRLLAELDRADTTHVGWWAVVRCRARERSSPPPATCPAVPSWTNSGMLPWRPSECPHASPSPRPVRREPRSCWAPMPIRGHWFATPSPHRLALTVEHDRLPALLLELAEAERGTGAATVAQDFVAPVRAAPGEVPDLPSRDPVHCCLHPADAHDAIDPAARAVVSGLLADGVPTRTAAKALATLTGWDRRRAYTAIVDWAI